MTDTAKQGRILLLGVTVCAAGCSSFDAARTYTVRDSAGVRIEESSAPAWPAGAGWRVDEVPVLEIGMVDGAEPYQFSRIAGVSRLADGRVLVADAATRELRFFDAQGRFLTMYGGRGSGPDEFQSLTWARAYRGDSLAVWDGRARQLTVIDAQSRRGRTLRIALPMQRDSASTGSIWVQLPGAVSGVFDDGTLLVTPSQFVRVNPGDRVRLDILFLHYSADGEPLDTIGSMPGPENMIPTPGAMHQIGLPFARRFVSTVHDTSFYHGPGQAYEIRVYANDGSLKRVMRALNRDLRLTEEAREAYRVEQRASVRDDAARTQIERALADVQFPESVPPYSRMLVDAQAHLWVQNYRLPGQTGPNQWLVFNREGRLLGTVATPERFEVHQIDQDMILGVATDELDVPYVRLYRLQRY